jgi:type IV secretory pathway TrbL component
MKCRFLSLAAVGLFLCAVVQTGQAQVGRGAFGFGLSVDGNMLQSDCEDSGMTGRRIVPAW